MVVRKDPLRNLMRLTRQTFSVMQTIFFTRKWLIFLGFCLIFENQSSKPSLSVLKEITPELIQISLNLLVKFFLCFFPSLQIDLMQSSV